MTKDWTAGKKGKDAASMVEGGTLHTSLQNSVEEKVVHPLSNFIRVSPVISWLTPCLTNARILFLVLELVHLQVQQVTLRHCIWVHHWQVGVGEYPRQGL